MSERNQEERYYTLHVPCFEVVLICTNSFLADVKVLADKLNATQAQITALEDEIKGIDYAKYINDYVPPNVHANDTVHEQVVSLQTYRELFKAYRDELKPHVDTIWSVTYGSLLWKKYIEGATWARLSQQHATSRSTLVRYVNKARVSLYVRMPEQYRRYSIPNAEIY